MSRSMYRLKSRWRTRATGRTRDVDGGIRIAAKTGSPYVITILEQIDNEAVLKISPGREGSNAHKNWVHDHNPGDGEHS
jgi:hypothetical protein